MCCNVFSLAIGTYFEKRVFVMNGFVYLYDLLHSLRILVFQLLLSSRKKTKTNNSPPPPLLIEADAITSKLSSHTIGLYVN